MIKAIRKMMNKPVELELFDCENNCVVKIGGGVESNEPGTVLILRGLSDLWLVAEWKYSGQTIIIPAADIVCIASDVS